MGDLGGLIVYPVGFEVGNGKLKLVYSTLSTELGNRTGIELIDPGGLNLDIDVSELVGI